MKKPDSMKLYVMCSGLLHYDQSVFTYDHGCGVCVEVPSLMFLIEHPQGRVLFDTGLDPILADDPHAYWGEMADFILHSPQRRARPTCLLRNRVECCSDYG